MKKLFTLLTGVLLAVGAQGQTISFSEAVSAGNLDGKTYGTDFVLTITDGNSKMSIDSNNQYFGTVDDWTKYGFRLKTGGKSDSKNALKLTIPSDGTLTIAMRSSSSGATRKVTFTQNSTQLAEFEVKDANATTGTVDGIDNKTVWNDYTVSVKAGEVDITYDGGTNFYGFILETATGISTIKAETAADGTIYNLQGQRVDESYRGVVIKNGRKVVIK